MTGLNRNHLCAVLAAIVMAIPACSAEAPDTPLQQAAAPCPQAADRSETRAAFEAQAEAALAAAAASKGSGSPALWTLSDEDTTLYIMGTVHILRPEVEWKSPEIREAIAQADTIVFEADTTSPDALRDISRFMISEGLFQDGRRLSGLLSLEDRQVLEAALPAVGLPLDAIEPMRPWFAAINISLMQLTNEGFDPESGVEKVIEAAVPDGASFEYLETAEQQLGEFTRLDDCEQVDFLIATALSLEEGHIMLDLLVDEWADGDVEGLGHLIANPEMLGSEAVYDAILRNRNQRWVSQISAMLDEPGTRLIAVGAGHLAGPDSVIELLRAEGYSVEGP